MDSVYIPDMETKVCKDCKIEKHIMEFYFRKERNSYSTHCRICHCIRTRANYKQNRQRYRLNEKIRSSTIEYKLRRRQRKKERKANEPNFYIKTTLRCRLNHAIKGYVKSKKTEELLGCTWDEARKYIESKFKDGMTWNNHGLHGWHIDHIIPLNSAKTKEEIEKLFHYTNLQPLWAKENLSKGDSII